MKPEDIAAEAERRAAALPPPSALAQDSPVEASDEDIRDRLTRWGFIEVDEEEVIRSTRRLGAPITWFKRMLAQGLRQYHIDQNAKATRFNLQMVGYVERLERRIVELERKLGERDRADR